MPRSAAREERPSEVVDAERRLAPAGGRAPGERPGGEREGAERRGPGRMRREAPDPIATDEVRGEPQRDQRRREGEEGVHGRGL